jgi:hypothetical protein
MMSDRIAIISTGISMGQPGHRRGVTSACQGRWVFVIVLAICGLTVSLATRTFRLKIPHRVSVISGDAQAMRQHMDRDAEGWAPPVPLVTAFEVATFYPYVAPAGPPLASVLFDETLYNRPPPSC